jgi:hypothetical protein
MMARVRPTGIFELLSAAAWAKALGYALNELSGKSLSDLMPLETPAAGDIVAALLDKKDVRIAAGHAALQGPAAQVLPPSTAASIPIRTRCTSSPTKFPQPIWTRRSVRRRTDRPPPAFYVVNDERRVTPPERLQAGLP